MAKNVNVIGDAKIDYREETHTLGIRIITPFQGMFAQVDKLRKELAKWFAARGMTPQGSPFLCYHVIDMTGDMEIEYGFCVAQPLVGDDRVTADVLPAGRYVSLIYSGSGLQGNKALIQYIRDNNLPVDRWDDPQGDAFCCRYEMYLTDPKIEPRKTKWDIEVAIKLKDE
jgi:effector-binding domain-containing protein